MPRCARRRNCRRRSGRRREWSGRHSRACPGHPRHSGARETRQMISRKRTREIIGYTHLQQTTNATAWFQLATSFHTAARLLHENEERIPSDSRAFALNAALSIELVLKAILAQKKLAIPNVASGHDLRTLGAKASVKLSEKQKTTLELLTETILWAGRYPGPKNERQWDDYQDRIFEKHVVRSSTENVYRVVANPETFPN